MRDEALPTVDAVAASVAIQFLEAKILLHRTRNFFLPLVLFGSYLFHIWLIISVTPQLVPPNWPAQNGRIRKSRHWRPTMRVANRMEVVIQLTSTLFQTHSFHSPSTNEGEKERRSRRRKVSRDNAPVCRQPPRPSF